MKISPLIRQTRLLAIVIVLLFAGKVANAADYYWKGGTGVWTDLTHWVTTSGGSTNHTIVPTPIDNVIFDGNSFTASGGTVTINFQAFCNNFTVTSGVGANVIFQFNSGLVASGTISATPSSNLTWNQTSLLQAASGVTMSRITFAMSSGNVSITGGNLNLNTNSQFTYNSNSTNTFSLTGTGSTIVLDGTSKFIQGSNAPLNVNGAITVPSGATFTSNGGGAKNLNSGGFEMQSGSTGTLNGTWNIVNGGFKLHPSATVTFSGGNVYFQSTTAATHYIQCGGRDIRRIEINGSSVNAEYRLLDKLTATSDGVWIYANKFYTDGNQINTYYFYSWTSNPVTIDFTGTDTVTLSYYFALYPNNNINFTAGNSVIKFNGTNHFYFIGGNKKYNDLVFNSTNTGDIQIYMENNDTLRDIYMNGQGRQYLRMNNNHVVRNFYYNHLNASSNSSGLTSMDIYGNLVVTGEFKYTSATVNMRPKWNFYGVNTINVLNWNSAISEWAIGNTQTIADLKPIIGTCARTIVLKSINTGTQRILSQATGSVTADWVLIQDIKAQGGATFTATNAIDLGNNVGWTITPIAAQNFYWIGGAGNWNDPNHWSLTSGGSPGCAVPSRIDSVFFDANSFSASGQFCTINANAECKNMIWNNIVSGAGINGSSATMSIYGSLKLDAPMNYSFSGQLIFQSKTIGNTIETEGKTITSAIDFQCQNTSTAEYTLLDNLKTTNSLTLTYGKFFSGGKDLDIYSFLQSSGTGTVANFTGTALIKIQNQWYSWAGGTLVMPLTTELRFESVNSHYFYSYGNNSANKKTYGKVVFNSTGTAGYDMYAYGYYNSIANMQVNYAGTYRYYNEMYYSVWDTLAVNFTNPNYSDNVVATMGGQYDTLNYVVFKSTGAIRPRLNTLYWFKANNFIVQNFYEWAHSNSSPAAYFGNITLQGSCNPRMTLRGASSGTQSIINCTGTATADNCIIKDIKIQGGGTYSTTNSGDGGNVTGWGSFGTGTNYYWVGGTGNWNDGSHWALSPGGAGSGCVPSQADNVFFDLNSFTASNQTVNVNVTAKFKNMLWSGVNNPILGGNQTMECYGSLTLAPNMQWNNSNILYFNSRNTGNTIKTGNVKLWYVYFNGDNTTQGGWTLQDSLNAQADIYFRAGNFVSNGYNVTARSMNNDINSNLLTLNFTGTKELKVNYQFITQPSVTVIMDTATLKFNYNGNHFQFDGGNHTFRNIDFNITSGAPNINLTGNNIINNINFTNSGWPIVTISGSSTYNDINFVNTNSTTNIPQITFSGTNNINSLSVNSTGNGGPWLTLSQNNTFNSLIAAGLGTRLYLGAGRTQTVNSVLALGNGSYPVIVQSTTSGTQGTIYKPTGQVCLDYVLMKDTKGDGISTQYFAGASSVNLGNNTNWIFSSCNAYYWVGGSGNWTDAANHWATSSGGTIFQTAPPGPNDNVFFDANSFTLAGQTVTVNTAVASCKNMKWGSAAFTPTFTGNTDLDIYGDLELINGMNQNFTGNWNFKTIDTIGKSINPANKSMTNVNFIGGASGIGKWTLQNQLTVSNNLNFDNGTLITNNKNIVTKNFNSITGNTRSLQLGSSIVTVLNGSWNPATLTNATLVEGTSTILMAGTIGTFIGNNLTYNNLTFDGSPAITATLTGTNLFNTLTLADGTNLSVEAGSTQTMNNLVANGTCGNQIVLQSTVNGTQANFTKASGTTNVQFLNIRDMKAQGGATFNANYSANLGGNAGWNFNSSPTVIDAIVSSTYVSCTTNNNGTATIDSIIGGIPPYTYVWSNSLTTRTITNLIPGSYTVTITDSAGCFVVKTINVTNSPSTITAVPFSASSFNVCLGSAINFTAGTPSQTVSSYLWNFGDFTTSTIQNPTKTYSAAGTYAVNLSYIDASGCPAIASAIVKVSNVSQSVVATNVLCRGDNNGTITITASNGVPPYLYSINNGTTYQASNSFTGLTPGTYQVRVRDSINCTTSTQNITITQPSAILAFSASTVGVSCAGNGDGSITINATGGTAPYSYSINNGILYVGSNLFSNLSSGTYNVIVRDANACVTAVQNITIGVSDNVMPTITCPSNITVAGTGGCTQAVTILAPTTGDNCGVASIVNNFNNTANASGNYPVGLTTVVWTVTDVNGNTATCSMVVTVTGPEISMLGNSATIADGDATPSTADHTDFGSVQLGQNFVRTFAIKNNGTTNLTINSLTITGTNASDFTIPAISLPVTISAGNTLALPVTFTPAALGSRTATVEVGSDDCDEATYDFAIQGTGICATPVAYNVTGTGSYCAGGTGVAVGLSNSQVGINYQLMLGASPIGSPVAGTGSSISFGNQTTAGTYTVIATNTVGNCTNTMTGSAIITINPLPTPSVTAGGPTTFCSGGSVNLSTGGISSLDFNGTNGYVTIPHSAGQVATQMTMEAWVYVRNTTAGGANILMKGNYGYGIHLGNDGCSPGNKLGYWVNSGCGSTILSTGTVPFNQWAHIAVVVTTSPTQTLNFYINGVAAGSSTSSSITINNGGNQALILGMQGTGCACNYFNGKMDEVRIWNTALTQAQIVANMNSTVSPSSSNLQVYLRADNASGTTATDLSVNGTNGTLVNGMSWEVPSSSPIGGYASYVWNPGGATTPSINVNNSGTYSVAVTDVNGCSATSASTTVTVNPLPSVFNVTGGGAYCSGGTGVAVGLDGSQTGINYQLKINGSNTGSPIAGTGSAVSFGNQTAAGSYTIVATNATTNCTSTMTGSVTVTVNPLPTVFAVTGGGSYCSGGTGVVVGLAGSQTGINYQLMNGASAVGSPVAGTNAAISFGNQTAAGTYTVVATNATTNCTANMSGSVTVTVNPLPVITPTSDQTLCANNSTSAINFSSSISGSTFAWTNTTPSIGLAASGTGNIPSFTALNTGATPVTATVVVTPTSPGVGGGSGGNGIAYIANYSSGTVTVVNSATNAVVTTITTGGCPYAVGVTPDGSKAYVADRCGGVKVINTATNTIITTISAGSTPTGIAISPDGSKVYVVNENSNTVSVISTATNTVTATISFSGSCPRGTTISPDGSRLYVANVCSNFVTVINTATNSVVASVTTGSGPNDVTITLDGSKVYSANNGASSVSVINTSTNTVSATIAVGSSPWAVMRSADATKVYVSNMSSNTVSVINIATNTVSATISGAFSCPGGMSFAPNGTDLMVTNVCSNNVTKVNTTTNTITSTTSTGTSPYSVGFFMQPGGGTGCAGTPDTFTITVNPTPFVYNVTGGGAYCNGGSGSAVGLSNSQTGVNYQLMLGSSPVGSPVAGTGSAISFGNQTTAGTYTVVATQTAPGNCVATMNGNATVTITTINNQAVAASTDSVCSGTGTTVSVASTQTGVSYVLRNDANNAIVAGPINGTGSAINFNTGAISSTTIYNVLAQTTAGTGGAIDFDGVNDAVFANDANQIDFTSQYTAEAMIYVKGYQYGTIVAKFEDDGNNRGWMINMGETGDNTKLCVVHSQLGTWTNPIQWNTGFTPALNTWYHIAVTFDGTLTSNNIKLYVNGTLQAQTTWAFTMTANAARLYVGGYDGSGNGMNAGANSRFFRGSVDELRLWNTVRTQPQIQSNMSSCLTGSESGLAAYYKFDDATGTTAVDSKSGNNGTLTNMNTSTAWVAGNLSCGGATCNLQMTTKPTVTVKTAPVFTACPSNISTNNDAGSCNAVVNYTATTTAIPAANVTYAFTGATTGSGNGTGSGSTFNKGITNVTVTATNSCGTATCTFTVTVTDNENPVIACNSNITQVADAGVCGGVVNFTAPVGTDNCTGSTTAQTAGLASGSTFPLGTTTNTFVVTDASGNTATCSFDVTIVAPEINVTGNGNSIVDGDNSPSATDHTDFGGTNPGVPVTKTYTIENNGTSALTVASITMAGTNASSFTVGGVTLPATVSVGSTTTFTVTFNETSLGVKNAVVNVQSDDCNEATYDFAVQGEITCAPATFTACPSNISTTAAAGQCSEVVTYTATTNGTPAANITYTFTGATTGNGNGTGSGATFNVGVTTVTINATNPCSNVNCTFTVTVTDDEDPVITAPANIAVNNDNGVCGAVVTYTTPIGTDNCPGATTAQTAGLASGSTFPVGTTTNTFVVTDAHGNTATASFDVVVTDAENPAIAGLSNVAVNNDNGVCGAVVNYTAPVGTDNCPGATTAQTAGLASGSIFPIGTTTNTFVVTDAYGHTATTSFDVVVTDAENPTIAGLSNIMVNNDANVCGAVVNYTAPVGVDNCPGATTAQTAGLPSGSTFPIGTTTNTFVVTDAYGHTATTSFDVVVTDNQVPVLIGVPANATVSCENVPAPPVVTASDNCSVSLPVTYSQVITNGYLPPSGLKGFWNFNEGSGTTTADQTSYGNNGTLTSGVNWVAGQSGTAVQFPGTSNSYVNIPNATNGILDARYSVSMFAWYWPGTNGSQQNPIIQYNANGWGTHLWQTGSNQLFVRFTQRNTLGFTSNLAANALIPNQWNCVGATYDYATGTAKLWCNGVNVQTLFIGQMELSTNYPVRIGSVDFDGRRTNSKVDNVAIYDRALSASEIAQLCAVTCPQSYVITRTWSTTDAHNNTTTASQTVTVKDTTAPVLTVPANIALNNQPNMCSAVANFQATATDNCSNNLTITYSQNPGTPFPVGTTTVTVTAKDECGNTSTGTFTVTVVDNEIPNIACASNITVNNNSGICGAVVMYTTPVGTDNCPGATTVQTAGLPSGATFPVGTTTNTFVVTDAHSNTNTCSFTVTVNDNEQPTISMAGITVNADNGSCAATNVNLGIPTTHDNCAVDSVWNNALSSYPVGNTTVTWNVRDIHGNTNSTTQTVTVVDNQAPIVLTHPATVYLNASGAVSITAVDVNNGSADNCAIQSISVSPNNFSCSNVGTNIVTLTVTDIHNNTATNTAVVTVVDTIKPIITCPVNVTVSCLTMPSNTGTATATDACGVQSVNYTDVSTYSANVADATHYNYIISRTWTATDVNGNASSCTQIITVQQLKLTAAITNVACYGTATGSIDLTVQGGVGSLTYVWSNGATTQDINSLILGNYSVTVTDGAGCTATATYTVTQPTLLVASAINVSPNPTVAAHALNTIYLGYGPQSVTLSSVASGGTPGYTYSWSPTTGVANPNLATTVVTPIVTTTYTLTITDANGCVKTVSKTIYVQDVRDGNKVELCHNGHVISVSTNAVPSHLAHGDHLGECFEVNGIVSKVSCFGGNNGSINITVVGSVAPYTYSWSNGATTEDVSGLMAGTYTVIVTSANGETTTGNFVVTQYSKIAINSTQYNVKCYGDSSASIYVSVSGGNDPYTYSWNNSTSTYRNRYNLPIGTYIVTVTDDNGCTMKDTTIITQPSAPLAIVGTVTNVRCNGDETGGVDITVTGGTGPYSYDWDDDNNSNYSNNHSHHSCNHSSNNHWCNHHYSRCSNNAQDLTNVDAGEYTVTVTDANGCEKTMTFTISEPAEIQVSNVKTNVSCYGGNNGTIDITVSGGIPPYTYLWNGGVTTQDRTGLSAGTYTVTVKDSNNCTKAVSISISQPALLAATFSKNNVSCYGGNNGSINLTVTGGTAPYTYAWSNSATSQDISNLIAGVYTVTVTDAKGCTVNMSVTITQPAQLAASGVVTNVACNGDDDGAIDVTVSGGTAPYSYSWNSIGGGHSYHSCSNWWSSWCSSHNSWNTCHQHSQDLSGIEAGTYTVIITDANGCSQTLSFTVNQPSSIAISAVKTNVSCNGGNNGAINITATGGTAPYTYKWNNNSTVEDRAGLLAGTYTVTVTDANGCTKNATYTITQPALLAASTQVSNVSCYSSVNGSVNLTVTGGTAPYAYSWSNSAVTEDITGLVAGTYTVSIMDSNGCTITKSATVTQPALLAVNTTITNVSCYGDNDGEIDVTVTGGTAPYTYKWDNNMNCSDRSGLSAGTYSLQVKDANYCSQTVILTVNQPTQITVTGVVTNVTCNNGNNGAINITATGGTAPYTYKWNNNATVEDRTGLNAGTYSVKVKDANGCEKQVSFTVTQPSSMSASIAVNPNPTVAGQATNTIYKGYGPQTVTLTASVSGGTSGYAYSWSPTSGVSNPTSAVTNVTPTSTTTYTVTVTDANGCTKTTSKTIEVINVQNGDYIRICHNNSNISVPVSSVASHLAHGDDLGYCNSNCKTCPNEHEESQPVLSELSVKELKVYPNPSTGKFKVELPYGVKGGEAVIMDMAGKVLQKVRFMPDTQLVFDMGDVAKGVYMVQILNGSDTYRALVSIQN